jgi:hypothetical protein
MNAASIVTRAFFRQYERSRNVVQRVFGLNVTR